MNYSRHLLCDIHQSAISILPDIRRENFHFHLRVLLNLILKPRKGKKQIKLFPTIRNSMIRKFPALIPFFKLISMSTIGNSILLARKPAKLWRTWFVSHERADIRDPKHAYVEDRLSFTLKQPKGAFFNALLKKVFRHVVNESVEDTVLTFVGSDALSTRFKALDFKNYMEAERVYFRMNRRGCRGLTSEEDAQFDLWSLALLYETWMVSERRRPRAQALTEIELINVVFAKLEEEIKDRAFDHEVGGYLTELRSLEQVRHHIIMLSELRSLLLNRSMNRSIFNHLPLSRLETQKQHPRPAYDYHTPQLGMFDINFLKREKIYTKLKYSRSPAYDIVSGGVAALFAGFLGFLISEKFGIELVDSGDFYTLFMYIVFLTFSTRPLLKMMNQNALTSRVWSASFFKYYLDSILWLVGQFCLKYSIPGPGLHHLSQHQDTVDDFYYDDWYEKFYRTRVYHAFKRSVEPFWTSIGDWLALWVRVPAYRAQNNLKELIEAFYTWILPTIRSFFNELDGAPMQSILLAQWRYTWARFIMFEDHPSNYSWKEYRVVLLVWCGYFILLGLTLLSVGYSVILLTSVISKWW